MSNSVLIRELKSSGVLLLTFNRAESLNAISEDLRREFISAVRETKTNDNIRVIVVTGSGRGFCSGVDVSDGGPARGPAERPSGRSEIVDKRGRPAEVVLAMAESDVPIVGAINGVAAGGGFGLALCCDIRIASDQARLGSIFIKRGIGPDYGTSFWLPRLVGIARAYEILYSGELIGATEALQLGLVHRVVPHDNLMTEALAYAGMIAEGPPLAYTYSRRAVLRSLENSVERQAEFEWTQQSELLASADAREGFLSFLERRKPRFTGA